MNSNTHMNHIYNPKEWDFSNALSIALMRLKELKLNYNNYVEYNIFLIY